MEGVTMFQVSRFRMIYFVLFTILGQGVIYAQVEKMQTNELKGNAIGLFESGDYEKANESFTELISRYPKDGMFHYYSGICHYKQRKDIPSAIKLLNFASSKSTVPADVFYYLGLAYRENYQFSESRTAFNKYSEIAGKQELKTFFPHHQAAISANAIVITKEYNPFEVLATSLFTFRDTTYLHQVRGKGGYLTKKPADFYSKDEQESELTSFVFMPKIVEKGEYVYFSGYKKTKKNGSDIYRIKKLGGKMWGDPEPIDVVNSDYDEILPYFDPVSRDLYFTSMGHRSMGGFDVFKSHYDEERDTWSEPVGLGFPVNSPHNEYIVLPGADLGTILVITDRQGIEDLLTVYKLHMREPKQSLLNASAEEIMKIGKLGGIEAIPAIVDIRKESNIISGKSNQEFSSTSKTIQEQPAPDRYQSFLKAALESQVTSDSLSKLARETRIKVKDLPDPNERWTWQRQIIEWEKLAGDYQDKADRLYADMKETENGNKSKLATAIRKDTVIDDITVYKFVQDKDQIKLQDKETEKQPEKQPEKIIKPVELNQTVALVSSNREPDSKSFFIHNKSLYNINNPFPEDFVLPNGAFYRIQLGVFGNARSFDAFGGISPITLEEIEGKNLIRYYAGKFTRYEDAGNALNKVRQQGISDAFIVSWYNGEKTSVTRVIELEKRDAGL